MSNILNMNETSVWFDMAGNLPLTKETRKQFIFAELAMKKTDSRLSCQLPRKVPTMMVYDSFKGHLEESVKIKFRDKGMTIWMAEDGVDTTAIGNFHRARLSGVFGWVKLSWDRIRDETIINPSKLVFLGWN
ncbi:hypothetical protein RCL_jg14034.t1 [Rhizophagus clarus]|uniref:DDE-1 domain-containing protein n=1 Tax=Rhizophagus clarus TaxID=94130 RepID=A0A8H3LRK3_9GLOM|nr:hypothetical protein RCL_jg14034.t1 [Rhizophagus clarus]